MKIQVHNQKDSRLKRIWMDWVCLATISFLAFSDHAIQHLIGDILDDVFEEDGSTWSDFKPAPRKRKLVQTKRIEATKD
jgi:hypothetical protein